jgi:hypothetical protein
MEVWRPNWNRGRGRGGEGLAFWGRIRLLLLGTRAGDLDVCDGGCGDERAAMCASSRAAALLGDGGAREWQYVCVREGQGAAYCGCCVV